MGTFRPLRSPPPALPASQAHGQTLGGAQEFPAHPWPCALPDARAQGQGGGGRFLQRPRASLSSVGPETRETNTSQKSVPPSSRSLRSSLPLKGYEPLSRLGPPAGREHLQRPRGAACSPSASQQGIKKLLCSVTTHRPGRGSEMLSYPPKVTQPWLGCDLRDPSEALLLRPPGLEKLQAGQAGESPGSQQNPPSPIPPAQIHSQAQGKVSALPSLSP